MNNLFVILFTSLFLAYPTSQAFSEEGRSPVCPQDRRTQKAPAEFLNQKNPISKNKEILAAGKEIFEKTAKPLQCQLCHGIKGNGLGDEDFLSNPPARNFTCHETMKQLPDGQLFWVIKNGSPGTAMLGYSNLKDEDIWKLIHYIREFAK